ncbi:MAG: YHYH protein [Gammaproteobacteria bacterium]|nr:YHYH protein [Gammaproteobacteria bacterium]
MQTKIAIANLFLLYMSSLSGEAIDGASSFIDNQLVVPYVTAGSQTYNITLHLVIGSKPPVFELGTYSTYPEDTIIPKNSSDFSANILSIPKVFVGNAVYQAKLTLTGTLFQLTEATVVPNSETTKNPVEARTYLPNVLNGQLFNQVLTNRDPDCRSYIGNYDSYGMEDRSNFLPSAPFFPGTNVVSKVQIELVIVRGEYNNNIAWDYDSVTPTSSVKSATHCRIVSNMIPNHDFGWEVGARNQSGVWVSEIDHDDVSVTYIPVDPKMPVNMNAADTPRDPVNYMNLEGILLNGVGIAMDSGFCFNPDHNRANEAGNATGCGGLSVWYELPAYTLYDSNAENMAAIFDDYFGHGFEGTYHYHAVTHPLQANNDQTLGPAGGSPLIGFARDGFPIYGHWFVDENGDLVKAESGYILKTYELNNTNSRDPYEGIPANFDHGTPPTPWDIVNRPEDFDTNFGLPLGRYEDDWVYDSTENTGNLDMCNGATDANGNYGYYLTDKYPFTPPCVFGLPEPSFGKAPPLRHEDEDYNNAAQQATNGH